MTDTSDARVALVTGAAMGIGKAIAARPAQDGFTVLVSDLDEAGGSASAAGLRGRGLPAEPLRLDVSAPDCIAAAFGTIAERHGRCDVVVNDAGIGRPSRSWSFRWTTSWPL